MDLSARADRPAPLPAGPANDPGEEGAPNRGPNGAPNCTPNCAPNHGFVSFCDLQGDKKGAFWGCAGDYSNLALGSCTFEWLPFLGALRDVWFGCDLAS